MFSSRCVRFVLINLIAAGWCYCSPTDHAAGHVPQPQATDQAASNVTLPQATDQAASNVTLPQEQIDKDAVEKATVALWGAVDRNDPTAAGNAIASGANVEWRNPSNFTPLHLAALAGHLEVTSVLLSAKANKEVTDSNDDRPLHLAIANGRDAVVTLLVVAGADLQARGQGGLTPLQRAAGDRSTVSLLQAISQVVEHADCNPELSKNKTSKPKNEEASQALWTALEKNDAKAVRAALDSGADVEDRNWLGNAPLHWAAFKGEVKVINQLLEAGADIESINRDGDRPLHVAATYGKDGAVKRLVRAGANLNVPGYAGRSPLRAARERSKQSTVALLLSLGATE